MSEDYKQHNHGNISHVDISKEMKKSFLEYSMSVIVSRALPDVRDGLKPVHRRILYSMNDLGMHSDKPHKKSARIVGDVIGKYHPHGDTAVYDSMVRMAQDFSYRYQLVDGHGNFGSIDGDGAAAMRYTEARMSKISMELLRDLQKDTVDFIDNYDGEEKEPAVLPAKFPNLLANGTMGIAVGMATNIPPHNLSETIDAIIAVMDDPEITVMELMSDYIFGPDFPTGGYILGRSGIRKAFETGRGSIIMRAKAHTETDKNGKKRIIVTEIPYQVNKAKMIEKIAHLVRDKAIEGITDLRDESNRDGIKIVIELRRDVQEEVVLNQLYRMTALQSSFGVNMLALVRQEPHLLSLKDAINYYIEHQVDVTERATKFDLKKAEDRAHILEGLRIALDHIDEIISTIRNSKDDPEALASLVEKFSLSEIQAKAIMDMQLRRLTGLQRSRIEDEYSELLTVITDLKDILSDPERVIEIIKNELGEIKNRYGDKRRSEIIDTGYDVEDEDLIPVEEVFISMTENGYIKRIPTDTYRTQNRGGRGIKGMTVNEDDVVDMFIQMSTHDYLLLFTNFGKVYRIKGYEVPNATRTSKGIPVINLLNMDKEEKVKAILTTNDADTKFLFFATKNGIVKRVAVSEFDSIRKTGKIAITLKEEDELVYVRPTSGDDEIIIAGSNGKAVRFHEEKVRNMGRTASGVRGFNADGSEVVGLATDKQGPYILSVTKKGYGKKTHIDEYRLTNRGNKGVISIQITEKNGPLVALRAVKGDEDLMIMSDEGIVIRIGVEDVATYGRNTQGVKLINLNDNASVATIALADKEEDESEVEELNS